MSCRVLITGCSGFIGSRLALRANLSGFEVFASTRNADNALALELGMPILEFDVLRAAPQIPQVDVIIHCATANDILSRDFNAGVNLSVCGTRNVLESAVSKKIKRVIFLSTLQVYGTELEGEISEDSPICCETGYALNHNFGEELCRMYTRTHNLDTTVLRPANVYGIPDVHTARRFTLVPMCFVKEAVEFGTLTLRSSGLQRRNFVSTDEVADVCLSLLSDFPPGFQVINVASEWVCSIREIHTN